MSNYRDFIKSKSMAIKPSGFEVAESDLNPILKDFQRDAVRLALRVGRFCLFEDTGLGKGLQSMEWANQVHRHTGQPVLILAPLGVAKQFVREGKKFGYAVKFCDSDAGIQGGINVTNYDKLHKFDCSVFGGVVVDESAILKNETGKTRNFIIESFRQTPYKLSCSATPAPNDYMELGNQCEFLGVMSQSEMLAMFFTHDGGDTSKWRLKKHAQGEFWKWVCTWALTLKKPSDLGYSDEGYDLPPLEIISHSVTTKINLTDNLIDLEAVGLSEQRKVRRESIADRCQQVADLANATDEQVLVWCDLNDESAMLTSLIDGAVEVSGAHPDQYKEDAIIGFAQGNIRVLVSKVSIFGYGLNLQNCHQMIFTGLGHSFSDYYQAIRRVYRFGQQNSVTVHVVQHEMEGAIERNLRRKEQESEEMARQMVGYMQATSRELLGKTKRNSTGYDPQAIMQIPLWLTDSLCSPSKSQTYSPPYDRIPA